jgi:hypothetical protein
MRRHRPSHRFLHGKLVVPRRTFSKKEIVGSNPSANVGR